MDLVSTLDDYRAEVVRQVGCPYCKAVPGARCRKMLSARRRSVGGEVDYVHDDRSWASMTATTTGRETSGG